jgi:exodeoxyribonuclease VII large subunit
MINSLFRPESEQVLNVTELTRQIKVQLEDTFTQIWVRGEVSNLRRQSSGHVYFSLKDSESQLPCVLFARDAIQQGFDLADGMEVIVFGNLSVYEPHGRYQLIAKIALQSGQGQLQLELERLKRKLAAEGLFEKERKRSLPMVPMRIAVITSPTGAAIRDFLRILQRRNYRGEVVILPARVQGKEAPKELAQMLEYAAASSDFDLVVLTRGGGSIEDLWAFNDETLARKVADCSFPVISAVGHEIDTVLTDYVADQRAETPSAAAELISSLTLKAEQRLQELQRTLLDRIQSELSDRNRNLNELQAKMQLIAPQRQIQMLGMQLDDLENRLSQALKTRLGEEHANLARALQRLGEHHPRNQIRLGYQSLDNLEHSLTRAVKVAAHSKKEHVLHLQKRLENSSLQATLRRGYSVLKDNEGKIVDSADKGIKHDHITACLQDGELQLQVLK